MSLKPSRNPATIHLEGVQFECYQAGSNFGAYAALHDAASGLRGIHRHHEKIMQDMRSALLALVPADHRLVPQIQALPDIILTPIERQIAQLDAMARGQQDAGNRRVGQLALLVPHPQARPQPWWKNRASRRVQGAAVLAAFALGGALAYAATLIR